MQADFDVVVGPLIPFQNSPHRVTEIAFYFEDESAYALRFVLGFVGDELLGKGIHAAGRLAGPHCSQDCDASVEAAFRDRKPVSAFSRGGFAGVVNFSYYDNELVL